MGSLIPSGEKEGGEARMTGSLGLAIGVRNLNEKVSMKSDQ